MLELVIFYGRSADIKLFIFVGSVLMSFSCFKKLSVEIKLFEQIIRKTKCTNRAGGPAWWRIA